MVADDTLRRPMYRLVDTIIYLISCEWFVGKCKSVHISLH